MQIMFYEDVTDYFIIGYFKKTTHFSFTVLHISYTFALFFTFTE